MATYKNKPGPRCDTCPLRDAPGPVWGDGSPNATLVNIGMGPAHDEIQHGGPFKGKSGQVLDRNLREAGVGRGQTYTTNVVKCFLEPGKQIPPEAVRCCEPLLRRELDTLDKPDLTILTLGAEPFYAFTHKKLALQSPQFRDRRKPPDPSLWLRGCVYTVSTIARRVIIPTMHPAYLLRTGYAGLPFFQRDVRKAVRFSEGKGTWYEESLNYRPTSAELQEYVDLTIHRGHFGVDIETPEKLDDEEENSASEDTPIEVIGVSSGIGECIGAPPDLFPLLKPLFGPDPGRKPLRCYAFNWGFDGYHLGKAFDLAGVAPYDVMKAWVLTYSDSMRKDLGAALSWWTDMPYTKNLRFTAPDRYNACDTYGALWAGMESERELRDIGSWDLFRNTEMPLVDILTEMEHVGVNCDVRHAQRMELTCYKALQQYEKFWVAKLPTVSWSSPQQLAALFKAQGLPIQYKLRVDKQKHTRKRTVCVDEEVLELYRDTHQSQLAGLVLLMRKLKKAADFCRIYSTDGRAHARYKDQRGGRIQAKDPDLQNIPEELSGIHPRSIIIPDDPENDVIISADYEALEFYIYGYAAKDRAILETKRKGEYIYGLFYKEIFGKDFFQPGKPPKKAYRRKEIPPWELLVAKSGPLGMLYDRGVVSLQKGFAIPRTTAERIYTNFHTEHPGVRRHHTDLLLEAHRSGFVRNFFGRIRRFPNPAMGKNEICAFTGQGNGADVLKQNALVRVGKGIKEYDGRLLLTVHDSIAVGVPRVAVLSALEFIRDAMEYPIPQMSNFWIPVTIKIGSKETSTTGKPNWNDCIPEEDWITTYAQRTRPVGEVQAVVEGGTV